MGWVHQGPAIRERPRQGGPDHRKGSDNGQLWVGVGLWAWLRSGERGWERGVAGRFPVPMPHAVSVCDLLRGDLPEPP